MSTQKSGKARKKSAKKIGKKIDVHKVEVIADDAVEIDTYHEEEIKAIAKDVPELRFKHSSHFTDAEDKIIAASLMDGMPLYRIAMTLKCHRTTLRKHIEDSEELTVIAMEAQEKEDDEIEEGIRDLRRNRHPAALLWLAERRLPEKYGKDRNNGEEDDSKIVIGVIPEEDLVAGDKLLEEAASKPPEAGLAAMLDERALADIQKASEEAQDENDAPSLGEVCVQVLKASAEPSKSDKDVRMKEDRTATSKESADRPRNQKSPQNGDDFFDSIPDGPGSGYDDMDSSMWGGGDLDFI